MVQDRIITVMGSPGSGKTTASLKMALELAAGKKNVILVFCDPFTPVIPYIIPLPEEQESIGALLTAPVLTQKMILDSCIPVKENPYISLLGYRQGEGLMSYPQVTRERAVDFLVCLRYLADYIIIDCSTVYEADVLSMVAMELADSLIKLGTSSMKGISYFESHRQMLSDSRYHPERQLMFIGNLKEGQEWEAVSEQYGGVDGMLPYVQELERQHDEASLLEPLTGRESAGYMEGIRMLLGALPGDDVDAVNMGRKGEAEKREDRRKKKLTRIKQEKRQPRLLLPFGRRRGEF